MRKDVHNLFYLFLAFFFLVISSRAPADQTEFLGLSVERFELGHDFRLPDGTYYLITSFDSDGLEASARWPHLNEKMVLEMKRCPIPIILTEAPWYEKHGVAAEVLTNDLYLGLINSRHLMVVTAHMDEPTLEHELQHAQDVLDGLYEQLIAMMAEFPDLTPNGRLYLLQMILEGRGYARQIEAMSGASDKEKSRVDARYYGRHLLKGMQTLRELSEMDSTKVMAVFHQMMRPFDRHNLILETIRNGSRVFKLPSGENLNGQPCQSSLLNDLKAD